MMTAFSAACAAAPDSAIYVKFSRLTTENEIAANRLYVLKASDLQVER